jgi:hypothetical protein
VTRAWPIVWVLLAAVAVWCIASVPYLPTNDGPQHVLSGVIQNHFEDPPYPSALIPQLQFAEHGFPLFFLPLESLLGWRRALVVTLSLFVLGLAGAFAFLVRRLARERWPLMPLGLALAFGWPLYMGFFAFMAATAVGLCALALSLDADEAPSVRRELAIGALLALVSFMHVVVAAFLGLAIAIVRLAAAPKKRTCLALAALAIVPLAILLATLRGHSDIRAGLDTFEWQPLRVWLREVPRLMLPGPPLRAWITVIAVLVSLTWGRRRPLWIAATTFLAVGLVAPLQIPGWDFFSPRFFTLVPFLALPLLPVERSRHSAAIVAAVTLASLLVTARFHQRLYAGVADAFAGIDAIEHTNGHRLPLIFRAHASLTNDPATSEVPHSTPLFHFGALYAAARGGLYPYMFAGSSSTYAFFRRDGGPPAPDLNLWQAPLLDPDFASHASTVLTQYALYGTLYRDVLLFGATPEQIAAFIDRGYELRYRAGATAIVRARGCALSITATEAMAVTVELAPAFAIASQAIKPGTTLIPLRLCGPMTLVAPGARGAHAITAEAPFVCRSRILGP